MASDDRPQHSELLRPPGAAHPQPESHAALRGKKTGASSIVAALKNEPFIVFGDGEQSSDFVYIDDVVEACLKASAIPPSDRYWDIGTGLSTP